MENKFFDKFINDSLNHLDGGEPLDTWDQLNDKLDANLIPITQEDLAFDQNIKNNIEDVNAIEMADWENFLPALELDENLSSIDMDMRIETAAKSKLSHIEVDYDPNTWPKLSDKLDLEEVITQEEVNQNLDQLAYDKLLNYTVPQGPGDWEILEKKLDKEFILPFKLLFKYKLAEVSIVASLILLFFQVNPILEQQLQNNNEHVAQEQIPKTEVSESSKFVSENAINETFVIESIPKKVVSIENKKDITPIQQIVNSTSNSTIDNSTIDNSINQIAIHRTAEFQTPQETVFTNSSSIVDESILKISSTVTPVVSADDEQTLKEEALQLVVTDEPSVEQGIGPVLSTAMLPSTSLVSLNFKDKGVQFCKSCYNLGSILRWRLGVHLDSKFDYIMTAHDNILDIDSYNHSTFGYGAGLSTSVLLGQWELESGFSYAARQYTPRVRNEIIGSVARGFIKLNLDKIQMNVLSIPLNLRYHFNSSLAKTHFYIHGGATLNVATHATYFVKSESVSAGRRPTLNETSKLIEESDTFDKIFSNGWFEGGSYLENKYYSANLGFGFERKFSARYSVFGQATYSQFLENRGLGPNDDRFNSVNFTTGVRALFK